MAPRRLFRLDHVSQSSPEWLWYPYLRRGGLTLLEGGSRVGKSTVALDLAARLSRGGPLPGGGRLDRGVATLLLNADLDPGEVVRPQLAAGQADLSQVYQFGGVGCGVVDLHDSDDLEQVEDILCQYEIELMVVDPLSAFFSRGVAHQNEFALRAAFRPLAEMAADRGVAVLLVHSTRIGRGRSLAEAGVFNPVLELNPHPQKPRQAVLSLRRTNHGSVGELLVCRPGAEGQVLEWFDALDQVVSVAGSPVEAQQECEGSLEAAARWLKETLASGVKPAREIIAAGALAGHRKRTLERAKAILHVQSEVEIRDGQREWVWIDVPGGVGGVGGLGGLQPKSEETREAIPLRDEEGTS